MSKQQQNYFQKPIFSSLLDIKGFVMMPSCDHGENDTASN